MIHFSLILLFISLRTQRTSTGSVQAILNDVESVARSRKTRGVKQNEVTQETTGKEVNKAA